MAQSISSENDRKLQPGGRACDDNELVKHMSNVPGFLLNVEKENTIQEKALNFGVLDWKCLEQWKYTERMPGKFLKQKSPSGNSFFSASGPPKIVPILRKQTSSHSRNASLSYSAIQPMLHGSHFSSPWRGMPLPHSSYLNLTKEKRDGEYHVEEDYVECIKSNGKETCSQEYQAAESFRIGRQQTHFQQRVGVYEQSCSKVNVLHSKIKDPEKEMMSEREALSSLNKQGKHKISLLSPNKISAQGKKNDMRLAEVKLTSECCPADSQNIALQVSTHLYDRSCTGSSQSTEPRTSLDSQLPLVAENRLYDFFSPQELYSGVFSGDIPHSCPLPSSAIETQHILISQAIDVDTCTSASSATSISSEEKCSMMNEETARSSVLAEASNRKQAEFSKQPASKGRSPSPARRFSFNLGRMGRSFSFKESSAPKLSSTYTSTKSGPVRPQITPGMDNLESDQTSSSSRGRSSPLRRLLDPLLKPKTSVETVQPLNGSLHSRNVGTRGPKGPSQDRKPETSSSHAFLQLTFKNELPFFKLVLENTKDVLAAGLKRLPASGKSDPCMIYTFYSVHEIKKKSMNWMNHGSKNKSCSLGYSIIGQMKISSSSHLTGNICERDAKECVLYGVDPAQVEKQILEFVPNKEIAAIVVKNTSEKVSDGEFRDKNQLSEGRVGIEVILPDGVHSMPIKGAPSSLISRWKSGGSCDCGGWDVGCKLRILADCEKGSNFLQESISSSIDHINLYVQGAGPKSKPVFSLKPFSNEFCSMEFDASISLLEAFATSVAYVTCSKFPKIIETKSQSEGQDSPEADKRKLLNSFQEQIPAKYATCPPLSPVGRI